MSRSLWKLKYIDSKLLKKIFFRKGVKKSFSTFSRSSTIIPSMLGLVFDVYNGRRYISVKITSNMIGKKLGEFSYTKKLGYRIHVDKNT